MACKMESKAKPLSEMDAFKHRFGSIGEALARLLTMLSLDVCQLIAGYVVCRVATPGAKAIHLHSFPHRTSASGADTQSIACSPDGRIWVCGSDVHVFDSNGAFLLKASNIGHPYVAFYGKNTNKRYKAFIAKGSSVAVHRCGEAIQTKERTFGSNGTGKGKLIGISGIAIDEKGLHVLHYGYHSIQIFKRSGEFVRAWCDISLHPVSLVFCPVSSQAFILDVIGRVHACDRNTFGADMHRLEYSYPLGKPIGHTIPLSAAKTRTEWTSKASSIAVDRAGNLVVCFQTTVNSERGYLPRGAEGREDWVDIGRIEIFKPSADGVSLIFLTAISDLNEPPMQIDVTQTDAKDAKDSTARARVVDRNGEIHAVDLPDRKWYGVEVTAPEYTSHIDASCGRLFLPEKVCVDNESRILVADRSRRVHVFAFTAD